MIMLDVVDTLEGIPPTFLYKGTILIISELDDEGEYVDTLSGYMLDEEGHWELIRFWSYREYCNASFRDDSLQLTEDIESYEQIMWFNTNELAFERDIQEINISTICETLHRIVTDCGKPQDEYENHG